MIRFGVVSRVVNEMGMSKRVSDFSRAKRVFDDVDVFPSVGAGTSARDIDESDSSSRVESTRRPSGLFEASFSSEGELRNGTRFSPRETVSMPSVGLSLVNGSLTTALSAQLSSGESSIQLSLSPPSSLDQRSVASLYQPSPTFGPSSQSSLGESSSQSSLGESSSQSSNDD